MQKSNRTLFADDNKATWATAAKKTIKIPLDRWIAVIMLRATVTYDTAAGPTKAQDGVLNFVKSLTFKVNGKPRRAYTPSRYWYFLPLDLRVVPEFVDVTTSVANGKKASFTMPIYFRLDAENEDDLAALLPAAYLSSVEFEVEFGATGALGTAQTIVSGTVDVELKEIDLDTQEEIDLYGFAKAGVLGPRTRLLEVLWSESEKKVDAAYTNYKLLMDLPTGNVLVRSGIFATLNGARDDTLVEAYKVRDQIRKFDYTEESWAHSQSRDLSEYGPPKALEGDFYLKGFTIGDYVEYGPLDLREAKTGSHVLAFTVIAPVGTTNIVAVHQEIAAAGYSSG
jgi:hypothetical protein